MKRNGFTLIELLAVIVILAIIALIATPIILNIINDAKKEANERSVELYASAAKNAIARYQLETNQAPTEFSQIKDYIEMDREVSCTTEKINSDGSIYLAECTVGTTLVEDYTYGTEEITQVYKPQYYAYTELSGTVGETAPATPLDVPPTGKNVYLGYDVTNGVVSTAYACFTKNETEYCLKGDDTETFVTNIDIIKDAYADVVDTEACSFGDDGSGCNADSLAASANSNGLVYTSDGSVGCIVDVGGYFGCSE